MKLLINGCRGQVGTSLINLASRYGFVTAGYGSAKDSRMDCTKVFTAFHHLENDWHKEVERILNIFKQDGF